MSVCEWSPWRLWIQLFCIFFVDQGYTGASLNGGTHKSSILIGFSVINHPFWGTTIYGNTHISLESSEHFAVENKKRRGSSHWHLLVWFHDGLFSHIILVFSFETYFNQGPGLLLRLHSWTMFNSEDQGCKVSVLLVCLPNSCVLTQKSLATNEWKPEAKKTAHFCSDLTADSKWKFPSHLFDSAFKEKGKATSPTKNMMNDEVIRSYGSHSPNRILPHTF